MIISWNTKKDGDTYTAIVHETAYQHHKVLVEKAGFKTRARAKTYAVKMVRYLKSI